MPRQLQVVEAPRGQHRGAKKQPPVSQLVHAVVVNKWCSRRSLRGCCVRSEAAAAAHGQRKQREHARERCSALRRVRQLHRTRAELPPATRSQHNRSHTQRRRLLYDVHRTAHAVRCATLTSRCAEGSKWEGARTWAADVIVRHGARSLPARVLSEPHDRACCRSARCGARQAPRTARPSPASAARHGLRRLRRIRRDLGGCAERH